MTGFARADAVHEGRAIGWELRSVNGRSLDLRLRLPPGMERIEPAARAAVQRRFSRGNVTGTLTLGPSEAELVPRVNEAALAAVVERARRLHEQYGFRPASADGLLALRGVLEPPGQGASEEAAEALDSAVLACLEEALGRLEEARREEGRGLATALRQRIDRIEALVAAADRDPARKPEAIRERLRQQVELLAGTQLDPQRLHQEAMLIATRADIAEEIDRLSTHVVTARALLTEGGVVGRKLDFLAQEFNRESNTLCAKSNASSLTAIGLELKAVVDQFREQVQNLE